MPDRLLASRPLWLLLGCLWLFGSSPADAQTSPLSSPFSTPTLPTRLSTPTPQGIVALEGAVDPETYRVGPGDVFTVSIGGSLPRQVTVTVGADGRLVIPEAGSFDVRGETLTDVMASVRPLLQSRYRNVPTDVSLSVPRQFSVHVSGGVPLPGRYVVRATARLEDALAVAMGEGFSPRMLAEYDKKANLREVERRPALRSIRVTSRDGSERIVDLMRYYATGDTRFNPLLDDGDVVYLPTFDPNREAIFVSGAVDRAGAYDFREGDTALDLLLVASGRDLSGRVAAIRVTRTGTESSQEVSLDNAGTVQLQPRDHISVIPLTPEAGRAEAIGAVKYPGLYPILSGETTLQDLVAAAGGLQPNALLRGAYLERRARPEPDQAIEDLDLAFSGTLTSGRLDSTLTDVGRLSGLGLVGRRYYVQEYLRTPRVSVDIAAALSGATPVHLQDGDRLIVPRDLESVRVYGQVSRPGYVSFVEGLQAGDYVRNAGGTAPSATEVYVVEAGTGRFIAGEDQIVSPGDAVFVDRVPTADNPQFENVALQDRREERDSARDERQARNQTIQLALQAVGTLATLVFAYVAIRN